ncbi:MAG: hypothetical protein AB1324_01805 [Candidatus Micrarchaeota archaeon]
MAEEKAEAKPAPSSSDGKLWAALCYAIPVVGSIIVLATDKKQDKTLQFHAWQGLILGLIWWLATFLLSWVLIGCIVGPLGWLVLLYFAYKVYNGGDVTLPSVTEMAKKQVK